MEKNEIHMSIKLFVLPLLLASIGCSSRDCNNVLNVEFSGHVLMSKNALVIVEGGIAGHVKDVNYEDGATRLKLCLLDPAPISKNSTVEAGFSKIYGGKCVVIRPSRDLQFLENKESLRGVARDTIEIILPRQTETDELLKKRILETLRDRNRKDSLENLQKKNK
jgi:hypothetical protein